MNSSPLHYETAPLVEISQAHHDVALDIKYATSDNIAGRPIYSRPCCYLLPEAEERLSQVVGLAKALGLRLRIFDGYRPREAQEVLWSACPNADYIVPPQIGSNHTKGIAVDLTLEQFDGTPLDMGTAFDAMIDQSHHRRTDIPKPAQRNRYLLLGLMTAVGWETLPTEWWHFQLPGDHWPLLAHESAPEPMIDNYSPQ